MWSTAKGGQPGEAGGECACGARVDVDVEVGDEERGSRGEWAGILEGCTEGVGLFGRTDTSRARAYDVIRDGPTSCSRLPDWEGRARDWLGVGALPQRSSLREMRPRPTVRVSRADGGSGDHKASLPPGGPGGPMPSPSELTALAYR